MIKGANYAFRIAAGEADGDGVEFTMKPTSDQTMVLGVMRDGFNLRIFDLTEFVAESKNTGSGLWTLTMDTASLSDREITTFSKRI